MGESFNVRSWQSGFLNLNHVQVFYLFFVFLGLASRRLRVVVLMYWISLRTASLCGTLVSGGRQHVVELLLDRTIDIRYLVSILSACCGHSFSSLYVVARRCGE